MHLTFVYVYEETVKALVTNAIHYDKEPNYLIIHPRIRSRPATHQSSVLATQTGVLEPRVHVLHGRDDEGSHLDDTLPVLRHSLTALHQVKICIVSYVTHEMFSMPSMIIYYTNTILSFFRWHRTQQYSYIYVLFLLKDYQNPFLFVDTLAKKYSKRTHIF